MIEQWLLGGGAVLGLVALATFLVRGVLRRVDVLETHTPQLASLTSDLRGHVDREENQLWPKVDMLLERVTRIEGNLPNGELKELLRRFSILEGRLEATMTHHEQVIYEVKDEQKSHNVEAEDWKRRIVRLEDRVLIDPLRSPGSPPRPLKP